MSMAPEEEPSLSRSERLQLDYQQTTDLLRTLTDVRFKLLALVPTLSGIAVAVLGRPSSAAELIGIGLLGLTATVGLLLYELRNSQLSDYAIHRAQAIESDLGLVSIRGGAGPGGLFSERPGRTLRLFGLAPIDRDAGLIVVYSAALAAWTYLTTWGVMRALGLGHARSIGGGIGITVGLVLLVELSRIHERPEPSDQATSKAPGPTAITTP
jgi:hypothetical protein